MLNVHEEYDKEQVEKRVSEVSYKEAKELWKKVKDVFSNGRDNTPYVYSEETEDGLMVKFSDGVDVDIETVLGEEFSEGEVKGYEVIVLPLQLQEWYHQEPRYSDDYIYYQLSKKIEKYRLSHMSQDKLAKPFPLYKGGAIFIG